MRKTKPDISVRWLDSKTGEDFTDRMNDPSIPPGEGILELAPSLARLAAAEDYEAGRQLLQDVAAELKSRTEDVPLLGTPRPGDELTLNGLRYRYDGSTDEGVHFTRLKSPTIGEALVSLRRGTPAADWMLRQLQQ